jgi:orotate phosphoribosyltransferase-like protein
LRQNKSSKDKKKAIMAAAYSYDLRQKVLEAIDKGMRKSVASQVFNLSPNTIDWWLKRREVTGEFQALRQAIKKEVGIKLLMQRSFERL